MEFTELEQIRLQRLLRINSFLTKIMVIIFALLSIFVFKFILLAMISVEKAGIPLDSVVNIIKYHFLAFFDSFSDLTCKYILVISILLFINLFGAAANVYFNIFREQIFYIILFLLSIIVAFSLPIDNVFLYLGKNDKIALLLLCLLLMIPGPYILGRCLAKDAIRVGLYTRVFYILIYGLLLIQLFIEW